MQALRRFGGEGRDAENDRVLTEADAVVERGRAGFTRADDAVGQDPAERLDEDRFVGGLVIQFERLGEIPARLLEGVIKVRMEYRHRSVPGRSATRVRP